MKPPLLSHSRLTPAARPLDVKCSSGRVLRAILTSSQSSMAMRSIVERSERRKIMASLTIRDLPDQTKETLRVHAARSGLSLEAYARHLLQVSASTEGFQSRGIL